MATPRVWHSLSSDPSGTVLVAGEAPNGLIWVSADGGATWTSGNSTPGVWIWSDVSQNGALIVAVKFGGGMYTSTDQGVTWNRVISDPLVFNAGGQAFESVTVSHNGLRIAAAIQNGNIVLSNDGGSTWAAATLPGVPPNKWWRGIDGSADGSVLAAVSHNGEVYVSSDAGVTWAAVTVAVGTPAVAVTETWYRVKMSDDGNTIAIAANTFGGAPGAPGNGIYVSHDRGVTWTRGLSLTADYSCLAMSADGQSIAATVSNLNATPGQVLLSDDGGVTFTAQTMPGTDTNWRAIAMSDSGNRFVAATGQFNTAQAGLLYTGTR
ncbi:MAG: exo-alpha-sialidase [Pseudomonadota bacterium]